MQLIHFIAVAALVGLCIYGTLTRAFDDTLTQRAGMALTALAGTAEALVLWHDGSPSRNAQLLFGIGCALYGIGTWLKTWSYAKK